MKYHPLQLKQVFVADVLSKPAGSSDFAKTVNLTATPVFARSGEDPRQWQVKLNIAFKAGEGESQPLQYSGHIEVMGIFLMDATGMADADALRMVAVSAPTMLYGTARETLASLTARGPHGMFLLPTVTFSDQTLSPADAPKAELVDQSKAPTKEIKRLRIKQPTTKT